MARSLPLLSLSQISPIPALITKTFITPTQIKLPTSPLTKPSHLCVKRGSPITLSFNKTSRFHWRISTNMWWARLKGAIGQRFNLEGIVYASNILIHQPHLLLPHLNVKNIRYINWEELHRRGFKGVVFDKDNTITSPYSFTLWEPLRGSMEKCREVFGDGNVAVLSNSVGLYEFDPYGLEAESVERELGVRVVRHRMKKPAGGAEEIERVMGCRSLEVVMVGDRRFTDIVFGNRNGFFTILTEPLTGHGENIVVKMVRKVEEFVANNWFRRNLNVKNHSLLPNCEVDLVCLNEPL